MNPFIMNPEGVARFFAVDKMVGRARSPSTTSRSSRRSATTRCIPNNPLATQQSGGARVQGRPRDLRRGEGLPVRGDHLPPDRALPLLDQARAASTRSCSPSSSWRSARSWPRRRASSTATRCKVWSKRGEITRRGGGDQADQGARRAKARRCTRSASRSTGASRAWPRTGYLANTLTPFVGDANTQTPEFKAFLVNVEKA